MSIEMNLTLSPESEPIPMTMQEVVTTGGEPSGEIDITENGHVDVSSYATANVNVPQGIIPTGTIDIDQNGVVDVTNYASANVSVSGMPAYMSISEQTLSANSASITFSYDSTRVPLQLICYNTNNPDNQGYITNYLGFIKGYNASSNYHAVYIGNGSSGTSGISLQYGSISFDAENETVTITSRGGSYQFMKNRTYRIVIIYAES